MIIRFHGIDRHKKDKLRCEILLAGEPAQRRGQVAHYNQRNCPCEANKRRPGGGIENYPAQRRSFQQPYCLLSDKGL